MTTQSLSLETIEDFLAQKRIAMVGISREPHSFSIMLFEELCRRGYDVIPVNPNTPNVLGRRCFARLQEIQPSVEAALLMTSPQIPTRSSSIVPKPAYFGFGCTAPPGPALSARKQSHSAASEEFKWFQDNVPSCFCPGAGTVHRLHGFIRQITGRYPHRIAA